MPAKKGQTFNRYSEETKKEAVRLRVEEGWAYSRIMEKFGIKSESQIITWVRKSQNGESFEDYRGRWTKKHFSSAEEENAYLKAQVDYLKSSIRTYTGREAGFRSPVPVHSRNKQMGSRGLAVGSLKFHAGYYKWKRTLSLERNEQTGMRI